MPKEDPSQYSVKLVAVFEKDGKEISKSESSWSGLKYEGMVLIQNCLVGAMTELANAGVENAKLKGQGQLFQDKTEE